MKTYHLPQISVQQSPQRIAETTTKNTIATAATMIVTTDAILALLILNLSTLEVSAKVASRSSFFIPRSVSARQHTITTYRRYQCSYSFKYASKQTTQKSRYLKRSFKDIRINKQKNSLFQFKRTIL